jgi:hypothetical protein
MKTGRASCNYNGLRKACLDSDRPLGGSPTAKGSVSSSSKDLFFDDVTSSTRRTGMATSEYDAISTTCRLSTIPNVTHRVTEQAVPPSPGRSPPTPGYSYRSHISMDFIMHRPSPTFLTIIETDASGYAIGAVLLQTDHSGCYTQGPESWLQIASRLMEFFHPG